MNIDNNFIKEYSKFIYDEIYKSGVKRKELVEELYSQVIIRVLQTKDNYDPKKGAVTTWMSQQIRSVISNYYKKLVRNADVMDREVAFVDIDLSRNLEPSDNLEEIEKSQIEDLKEMVWSSDLSYLSKKVLNEHYFNHLSFKTIAEEMNLNENTAKKIAYNGIQKLRRKYGSGPITV